LFEGKKTVVLKQEQEVLLLKCSWIAIKKYRQLNGNERLLDSRDPEKDIKEE